MLQESEKAEITRYVLDRIEHVDEQNDPWPHRVIDGFFPSSFYHLLKDNFPLTGPGWKPLSHHENESGARQVIYLREHQKIEIYDERKSLWEDLFEIVNKGLCEALLRRYGLMDYKNETNAEIQIIKDGTGYKISPHCDTFKHKRHKLLTLLVYFPVSDELVGYGTELYKKKLFRGFRKVKQAPFTDNTALLFQPIQNVTWHGVSEITQTVAPRTSLQIFFKLRHETREATLARPVRVAA